ncbi:unnamed protein product [Fusarium graminearum]|nr:unnamed protein product [Fusarium graminearum]
MQSSLVELGKSGMALAMDKIFGLLVLSKTTCSSPLVTYFDLNIAQRGDCLPRTGLHQTPQDKKYCGSVAKQVYGFVPRITKTVEVATLPDMPGVNDMRGDERED